MGFVKTMILGGKSWMVFALVAATFMASFGVDGKCAWPINLQCTVHPFYA